MMDTQLRIPYFPNTLDSRQVKKKIREIVHNKDVNTYKVNHKKCPAGEDKRQRLYLTLSIKGQPALMWYCHNCGIGGKVHLRVGYTSIEEMQKQPEYYDTIELFSETKDNNVAQIIKDSMYWTQLSKLSLNTVSSPTLNYLESRLNLHEYPDKLSYLRYYVHVPVYNKSNYMHITDASGYYQIINTKNGKKYLPKDLPKVGMFYPIPASFVSDTLVITEDSLSAQVVLGAMQDTVHTFALLGTSVTKGIKENLAEIIEQVGIENIIVWLDADTAGSSKTLKVMWDIRTIVPDGVNIHSINLPYGNPDPKGLGPTAITHHIKDTLRGK